METTTKIKDTPVRGHPKWELTEWYMERSARLLNIRAVAARSAGQKESAGLLETLVKIRVVKAGVN